MRHVLLQGLDPSTIGEGALFLIIGGLFMLGLVVALVVLRSMFPSGTPSRGLTRDTLERRILPTPEILPADEEPRGPATMNPQRLEEGRREAARLKPADLDQALTHILRSRWGQPRILRRMDDRTVIRLHDCAECKNEPAQQTGCSFHAGFLEGILRALEGGQAQISETQCRRRGQNACEFEVRH